MAKWKCYECGASGDTVNRIMARELLSLHFGEAHNNVPWLEDE